MGEQGEVGARPGVWHPAPGTVSGGGCNQYGNARGRANWGLSDPSDLLRENCSARAGYKPPFSL